MEKKRILWLDAVRGVGILLVVLGHMALPAQGYVFIYAFHVPLFFIVTGYLYNGAKPASGVMASKFVRLMVPYYLFSGIMFALLAFVPHALGRAPLGGTEVVDTLLGLEPVITPTWFLPALFTATAMLVVLNPLTRRSTLGLILCLLGCVGVAQLWASFQWTVLPFRLNLAALGVAFLLLGVLFRKWKTWETFSADRLAMGALASLVVFAVLARWHGRMDMNANRVGYVPVFIATGVLGTAFVSFSCRFLENVKPWLLVPLVYMGERSLYVLAIHGPVGEMVRTLSAGTFLSQHRLDRVLSLGAMLAVVELFRLVDTRISMPARLSGGKAG